MCYMKKCIKQFIESNFIYNCRTTSLNLPTNAMGILSEN